MLKRFLSYYKPQMGLFVADTVCALVLAAIDLAFPIILRNLTGGLFTQGQAAIMQALGMIAVGLVLMYAVRCACRYFVSYWGHVMGARMESKMREDLFDQYERFSFAYFDRNSSGDMMSRVVNDLFDICEAAHHVPEWIIICGIEIIGSFVILFTIAPVLALAMAVVTAAFAVIMFWQNMRMREVFSDNRKKISGINAQLQDSLAGMRVVKSFANEETERFKFRASNNRYLSSKENMYHAMGVYTATYGLLSGVLYVIVVLLGGWLVAQGQLQAVDMATFALYISLFCTPLETLVNSAETYQKAIAGFKRMDEVLSTAPDIQDKPGATDLQVTAGAVEYHDVCFNYEDVELGEGDADERPVIDHMDLSIKPGQTIALVGPSGGGKSTTCSLLPRFYDVATGSISIDGQDVRDVTQQSLRRAIGLVQQVVALDALLQLPATAGARTPTAPGTAESSMLLVVLQVRHDKIAVCVDSLLDERDMVIQPLPPHMRRLPLVSGMVTTGSNALVSVLHAPALLEQARRQRAAVGLLLQRQHGAKCGRGGVGKVEARVHGKRSSLRVHARKPAQRHSRCRWPPWRCLRRHRPRNRSRAVLSGAMRA